MINKKAKYPYKISRRNWQVKRCFEFWRALSEVLFILKISDFIVG
jgi:hypothetical protein